MFPKLRQVSPPKEQPAAPPSELTSWKEIADFLGVAERTAQKWEAERGLPVKRLPGTKGRVVADPASLVEWKKKTLATPAWYNNLQFLRYYSLAATVTVLVLSVMVARPYIVSLSTGPAAGYRVDFNKLSITDASGTELWQQSFPAPFFMVRYSASAVPGMRPVWFGDLEQDGRQDTLFLYDAGPGRDNALIRYDARGVEQWRFTGQIAEVASRQFVLDDFEVADIDSDGQNEILLAANWLPLRRASLIALTPAGAIRTEHAHPGRMSAIELIDIDGDERNDVVVGGISGVVQSAALLVLDPRENFRERAMLSFPRSCINKKLEGMNRVMSIERTNDGGISVRVSERERDPIYSINYILTRALVLRSVQPTEMFRNFHRELESEGALDHPLTEAEVRSFAPVLMPGSKEARIQ